MRAIDVSRWQGAINWSQVQAPIAIVKVSGGDDGLYYDSQATANYTGAVNAGKAVGMYHFAGGHDPVEEADFFIRACSPLAKNDVMILDWEVAHATPVAWCQTFIQRVIDKTGVRPLIYMSSSRTTANDWTPVANMNVGLWVANYSLSTDANINVGAFKTYVMHQYTSSGREPGIAGNVDVSEWFGTAEQFKKYGFQGALIQDVTPVPVPTPPMPPAPDPAPLPPPTPDPVPPTPGTVIPPENQDPLPVDTPPAPVPTPDNNPIRPKVKAAGIAGLVLTALLGVLNALYPGNTPTAVDAAPLITALTTLVTVGAGYLKSDGLSPKK